MILIAILWGALVGNLINANLSYEDCKSKNFEPKACAIQKELNDLDQKLK